MAHVQRMHITMTTATERIPVLVTPSEKQQINRSAKAAGVSMGEFLRRAASSYRPDDDEAALSGLLEQVNKTTASASAAIDRALSEVAASNRRIAALESNRTSADT